MKVFTPRTPEVKEVADDIHGEKSVTINPLTLRMSTLVDIALALLKYECQLLLTWYTCSLYSVRALPQEQLSP